MKQRLRLLVPGLVGAIALATLIALSHASAAPAAPPIVRASNAATYLQPGDIMLNYIRTTSPAWWATAIVTAQKGIQTVAGLFNKSLRLSDPNIVHSAIYVGDGMMAEVYGTNPDDAGVQLLSVDKHPNETYMVSRPVDQELAKRAAAVAKKWAEVRRMTFLPPFHAALRSSSFGPNARATALVYGKGASESGGPKSVSSMFCSQFVIAAFQAAVVSQQLTKNPKLSAAKLVMPRALAVDAVNTSPLAQVGALRSKEDSGKLAFVERGKILIDPKLPPRPSLWDWVKGKFPTIFN